MLNDIVSNFFILIFHVAFLDHLYILLIKIVLLKSGGLMQNIYNNPGQCCMREFFYLKIENSSVKC